VHDGVLATALVIEKLTLAVSVICGRWMRPWWGEIRAPPRIEWPRRALKTRTETTKVTPPAVTEWMLDLWDGLVNGANRASLPVSCASLAMLCRPHKGTERHPPSAEAESFSTVAQRVKLDADRTRAVSRVTKHAAP
jgi:hypothetical protein